MFKAGRTSLEKYTNVDKVENIDNSTVITYIVPGGYRKYREETLYVMWLSNLYVVYLKPILIVLNVNHN